MDGGSGRRGKGSGGGGVSGRGHGPQKMSFLTLTLFEGWSVGWGGGYPSSLVDGGVDQGP